jgi:hypothetical protein
MVMGQSKAFERMFLSICVESSTSTVTIDDISPLVMEQLIRFLYLRNAELENVAEDLFVAADKYDLEDLRV